MHATAPHGFIRPCAPTVLGRAPRGPRWTHEIKHNGYRLCCRKNGAAVALWTRAQNEVGGRFARIAAALRLLPVTRCTIDGGPSSAGRTATATSKLCGPTPAPPGRSSSPLEVRRTRLAALLDQHARARAREPDRAILFSVAFAEDGAELFAQALMRRRRAVYR